ncbi:MAG: ABC transporter ATP-binding protein [Eubacteriales bacterium]|nr:ABC transporter ATP-binding protein [Eubacteriales bacterium]
MIELNHITKIYPAAQALQALKNVSLRIQSGEFVAITGPSGSGKSTLMNIIGCLDLPSSGDYNLNGQPVSKLSTDQLAMLRSREIGFIFQGFNLLKRYTALENVELPLIYTGTSRGERRNRAMQALMLVGLAQRMDHTPSQLSGGQQQRVAIARALVTRPNLILADEPTGNLDSAAGREVLGILQALHAQGNTILLITHDPGIAASAQRIITIRDGAITADETQQFAAN